MPAVIRIASVLLRCSELFFAAIVAGINGHYLYYVSEYDDWPKGRLIYAEVISGISVILSLIFIIPYSIGFRQWPLDLVWAISWLVVFGLVVNFLGSYHCSDEWHWDDYYFDDHCGRWRAEEAFSFLSAILWLCSGLLVSSCLLNSNACE